jgi:uncharacterized HAD superfamily protein
MSSIVIVDFDGVIADHTEHTKIAQERARAFIREQAPGSESRPERKVLSTFFYSERGFFDTELVEHDQLMPGCHKALAHFSQAYDKMVIVTSRPLSMREATLRWFSQRCPDYQHIEFLFKDSDESTIKTAAWKAQIVAHFAEQYDTLLFIDDDEKNRKTVEQKAADLGHVTISVTSCFDECFL